MSPLLMGLSVLDKSQAASVEEYTQVQVCVAEDLGFSSESALYDLGFSFPSLGLSMK